MSRAYERNGVWYTEITENGKKIRKKHGRDKKLAWAAIHKYEDDKQRGKLGYVDFKPLSVADFFNYCLNDAKTNLSDKSHNRYQNYVNNFHNWLKSAHSKIDLISQITPEIILEYKAHSKKTHSYTTVNGELIFLKGCFKLCREHGKTNANPTEFVPLYSEGMIDDLREHFILSPAQKTALIENCKNVYKAVIFTMLHTGMRRGEVTRLEWDRHIDLKNGVIRITKEMAKKGHTREIPINEALRAELEALPRNSLYVFPNRKGGKIKDDLVNVNLIAGSLRAGLTAKTTVFRDGKAYPRYKGLTSPHDLRHTFASYLVNDLKVPLPIAQKILGHKNVETTSGYLHVDHKHMREAVNQITF